MRYLRSSNNLAGRRLQPLQISLLWTLISSLPLPLSHHKVFTHQLGSGRHEPDCQSCKPLPALENTLVYRRVLKSTLLALDL